ncbi:MAG: undecaprenyl-diphosphate phosphatase [Planctomycetota bacterium]|jgi:undecaprenyl-diphosphatase
MDSVELFILGIVQGLTEFLPISSSGHLVVFKNILAADSLAPGDPIIEVALHLGTLLAILIYYRRDTLAVLGFLIGKRSTQQNPGETRSLLKWIIIGTIPTFLLGYFFKESFEACFDKPVLVGAALCITGVLCLSTRLVRRGSITLEHQGWLRSVLVGVAQGLAIIPGISRSGSTIVTGIFLGVEPREAGRFSFLLSIPAVAGAATFKFVEDGTALSSVSFVALGIGVLASAVVGLLCLGVLTRILKAGTFFYFGFYCIPLGLLVILYFA